MHNNIKEARLPQSSCMVVAKNIKQNENMTQDCLNSPSTADVSKRLPKGINITGADKKSDPGIEGMPWGYLFIHNKTEIGRAHV